MEFQFTCPSRSTTPLLTLIDLFQKVSIHVPLAEHDWNGHIADTWLNVSIHVPLAVHDH